MDSEDVGVGDAPPFWVDDVLEVGDDAEPLVGLDPVVEFEDRFEILRLEPVIHLNLGFDGAVFPIDVADACGVIGSAGEEPFEAEAAVDEEGEEVPVAGGENDGDKGGEPLG